MEALTRFACLRSSLLRKPNPFGVDPGFFLLKRVWTKCWMLRQKFALVMGIASFLETQDFVRHSEDVHAPQSNR